MILVTGAAGKTGRSILRRLAERGAATRAWVHRDNQVSGALEAGANELVVGDVRDTQVIAKALEGTRVVYHICPNMNPCEIEIARLLIDACRCHGIDRLVYHSVLHPQIQAMPHHWAKLRTEEVLMQSGMQFTIVQPAAYMQNLLAAWSSMRDRGVLELPYAAQTRLGMVDLEDVAEAAARVTMEDGHEGAIYELAGADVLTQTEVATAVGHALGRDVQFLALNRDQWAERARSIGLSNYAVESLLAMFQHYERHGFWGNPRMLRTLLGREPTSFASFCRRQEASAFSAVERV